MHDTSFTTGVRPGQLPKIAQGHGHGHGGGLPHISSAAAMMKGKHSHSHGSVLLSKRGSHEHMVPPGNNNHNNNDHSNNHGAGLPVIEKGKHQMIAWAENTPGGTWQGQGNEPGQGLGSAQGQGLGPRPVNNNFAETGAHGNQLHHKRPSSANPKPHPRNTSLAHFNGNGSGNTNGDNNGTGNGGNGDGAVTGGKRHAYAGVAEATAVSGALLRITDALVRKVDKG